MSRNLVDEIFVICVEDDRYFDYLENTKWKKPASSQIDPLEPIQLRGLKRRKGKTWKYSVARSLHIKSARDGECAYGAVVDRRLRTQFELFPV